jgi:hypothetical protein
VRNSGFNALQPDLLELISRKKVPDNGAIDVSDTRLQALRQQLDAQLKPVLRSQDFSQLAPVKRSDHHERTNRLCANVSMDSSAYAGCWIIEGFIV